MDGQSFLDDMLRELRKLKALAERAIDQLPDDDREMLESWGVRSFVVVPIFVQGQLRGYLSLEEGDIEREKVRREHGLRANQPTILFRPGGIGSNEQVVETMERIVAVGQPMNLIVMAVTVTLAPWIWPF